LARSSATAEIFDNRFLPGAGTGQRLRETVRIFRTILNETTGDPVPEESVYRLLRHFTMLRFDLLHEGARDEATTAETLRPGLHPDDAPKADDLW
jgi:hypothetical protein